jgi:glycosyltransferase involved in cell wall biosynthesis
MERVNTHRQIAKEILDAEYARVTTPRDYSISADSIQEENAKLELANCVFSPSPHVTDSLLRAGISSSRILQSTYGWSPQRLTTPKIVDGSSEANNLGHCCFLFVGTICIRKGAHLLLDAWNQGISNSSLVLKGRNQLDQSYCNPSLPCSANNLSFLPYSRNVTETFADADVFVFPTLEEGSPLVVYEAMAMGLPVITSPMGAGSIVRDGIEGFVVSPHDQQSLIAAMRMLASKPDLRHELGRNAKIRSMDYTWDKVAESRAHMLSQFFADQKSSTER